MCVCIAVFLKTFLLYLRPISVVIDNSNLKSDFCSWVKVEETRQLIMCGITGCVLQFVELVGYLGCDVKKTGLQLHLVFLRDVSHHIFWEI